jgi:ribosome-associated protein
MEPGTDDPLPGDVVIVDDAHAIPRDELEYRASRSSGPGGQHVNRSSTRIEVRWNPARSSVLTEAEKPRVITRLGGRVDGAGWVRVAASDTRSQRQNRALAEARLALLVRRALAEPRVRHRTKPTRASQERRLDTKRQHSLKKRQRRPRDWE